LKEEVLDGTLWRTGLEKCCGPLVRRTAECTNRDFCVGVNDQWRSSHVACVPTFRYYGPSRTVLL